MKKTAILILALICLQAKAQNYDAIMKSDSTSWITCHLELETRDEGHAFVNKRDNLLYYAPYGYTDYYCVGRIREDDGRLWIAFDGSPSEETLLVDMNLEVGDEFLVTGNHVAHVVETSLENGRKVIVFDYISPYWGDEPLKFIEGVGRNYTIFEWYGDIDRNYQSCKYDGDELAYSTDNPLFEDCKYVTTSIDELSAENKDMKIYPNPAKDKIVIEGLEACGVQVYNTLGQMVKQVQGTNEISVVDLPRGIYFVVITNESGRHCVRKMAKE